MPNRARPLFETPEYSLTGLSGEDLYLPIKFVNSYRYTHQEGRNMRVPYMLAWADPRPGSSLSRVTVRRVWPNGLDKGVGPEYDHGTAAHQLAVRSELADELRQKIAKVSRDTVKATRPKTIVFSQNVSKVIPLMGSLKYAWLRNNTRKSCGNLGAGAELLAGLLADRQPGEDIYRVISNGFNQETTDVQSAVYFLATPDELAEFKARLDKHARQRAKLVRSESAQQLVARMLL